MNVLSAYLLCLHLQVSGRGHACLGFHPGFVSEDTLKAKAGRVAVLGHLLRALGQNGGVESVTITTQQLPTHNHAFLVSTAIGGANTPQNNVLAQSSAFQMYIQQPPSVQLATTALSPDGGSQPHENLQPFLGINFIISLFGLFPVQG